MFRNVTVVELTDLETGEHGGYALSVGCMNFHLHTEEEVKKALVAIANDPHEHERAFYLRREARIREMRERGEEMQYKTPPEPMPINPTGLTARQGMNERIQEAGESAQTRSR